MAVATIDLPRLSSFLSVPQTALETVAGLSAEEVQIIFQQILVKAQEYDELKATKLRLEVELEQSVRTAENKTRGMKTQLESALKETGELRAKLSAAGAFSHSSHSISSTHTHNQILPQFSIVEF